MNVAAAFIGRTVCVHEGPIPILNRSKTLITAVDRPSLASDRYDFFIRGMISRAMVST
jgi:hypothetical protein